MNSYQLEELIKNIQAMIKCPSCGNAYKKENINFLGQVGQAVLVQLNCYMCKMPVMATIVASGIKEMPNFKGMEQASKKIPDFFPEAVLHSPHKREVNVEKSISTDEAIDFHKFLEDFDGNFENQFNK